MGWESSSAGAAAAERAARHGACRLAWRKPAGRRGCREAPARPPPHPTHLRYQFWLLKPSNLFKESSERQGTFCAVSAIGKGPEFALSKGMLVMPSFSDRVGVVRMASHQHRQLRYERLG